MNKLFYFFFASLIGGVCLAQDLKQTSFPVKEKKPYGGLQHDKILAIHEGEDSSFFIVRDDELLASGKKMLFLEKHNFNGVKIESYDIKAPKEPWALIEKVMY